MQALTRRQSDRWAQVQLISSNSAEKASGAPRDKAGTQQTALLFPRLFANGSSQSLVGTRAHTHTFKSSRSRLRSRCRISRSEAGRVLGLLSLQLKHLPLSTTLTDKGTGWRQQTPRPARPALCRAPRPCSRSPGRRGMRRNWHGVSLEFRSSPLCRVTCHLWRNIHALSKSFPGVWACRLGLRLCGRAWATA